MRKAMHSKHGGYSLHKKTYQCWSDMKQRCLNPRAHNYHNYGGRGIQICPEWALDFSAFLSDMGPKPDGMTLERLNVNGNYEPSNCRWATAYEQCLNRRDSVILTVDGVSMTLYQWARKIGLHPSSLQWRIRGMGMSAEEAIKSPKRPGNHDREKRAREAT
jgi:hypothetical protein